ncbi:MAG TPA: hypothetical protein VEJ38_15035 [Candidatus Acidoferrales bacterium]|nr:hypothetical protein [Candidatus Acidoferrales bacterium]
MRKRTAIDRAVEWLSKSGQESTLSDRSDRKRAPRLTTARPKRRSALARHRRKCSVCRHRDRDAIEQDFLSWQSPDQIAANYGIADHSSIYRHAHATGLFYRRAQTIRLALSPIVEQAMTVEVTANSVIRAIELLARLDADGRLAPPVTHIIHQSNRPATSSREASKHAATTAQNGESNRQNRQVGHDATH